MPGPGGVGPLVQVHRRNNSSLFSGIIKLIFSKIYFQKRPNLCGSEPQIALENEKLPEDNQDIVLTTSQHDIGQNLSKYDHFLSREDIMSPLKQANPSKLIYETIPTLLLEQFKHLTRIFEKGNMKELIHEKENEEWETVFSEEFVEKTFAVFMHRKNKSRGKIVMEFKEKTAQEIFAVKYLS